MIFWLCSFPGIIGADCKAVGEEITGCAACWSLNENRFTLSGGFSGMFGFASTNFSANCFSSFGGSTHVTLVSLERYFNVWLDVDWTGIELFCKIKKAITTEIDEDDDEDDEDDDAEDAQDCWRRLHGRHRGQVPGGGCVVAFTLTINAQNIDTVYTSNSLECYGDCDGEITVVIIPVINANFFSVKVKVTRFVFE